MNDEYSDARDLKCLNRNIDGDCELCGLQCPYEFKQECTVFEQDFRDEIQR